MKPTAPSSSYWQSLEQVADAPGVRESVAADAEQEFANYNPAEIIAPSGVSRRRFMKLMGASMALAGVGLTGCRRWPKEIIAPYAYRPQGLVPGVPEYFATVMEVGGVAHPLLAKSFNGRPIKLEGNPSHPYARTAKPDLGAADLYAQASVLSLYDPERSRMPISRTDGKARLSDWDAFVAAFKKASPAGVAVLSTAQSGPTFADAKKRFAAEFPGAAFYEYEPINRAGEMAGSKLAFGKAVRTILHLQNVEVLACFDGDPLGLHPAQIKHRADWAPTRKSADRGKMSRLYVAESTFSQTGTMADYRLPVRSARLVAMLAALASDLGLGGTAPGELSKGEKDFVDRLAADLKAHKGKAFLSVGGNLPADAVALGHRINDAFGTAGPKGTHHHSADPDAEKPSSVEAIQTLTADMNAGAVKTLLILGGNPVFNAPADLRFEVALGKVPFSAHLSDYDDETSAACKWHLNAAHYLESWGDARAWDGTLSVVQPLIMPIFDGRTPAELLGLLAGDPMLSLDAVEAPASTRPATRPVEGNLGLGGGFAGLAGVVRRTFRDGDFLKTNGGDFEKAFRRALNLGMVPGTAADSVDVTAKEVELKLPAEKPGTFEVRFVQDACLYDGRYANNGWLQEAPDPVTKLVWDNAALMSKADADRLGVKMAEKAGCEQVQINVNGRSLSIPVYILPGQAEGAVAIALGYGRKRAGHIGGTPDDPVGFDTYQLRTAGAMETAHGASVAKTDGRHQLVMTQQHQLLGYGDPVAQYGLEERLGKKGHNGKTVREASLAEYVADPKIAHKGVEGGVTLQLFNPPNEFNDPHAWGMAIDMTACTGCNQCVVACQAENNIPVVGKSQVYAKREMAWLRIDRYFKGPIEAPDVVHMPMMCQHCEAAPCEQVCPVAATVHDTEGLNVQVYNRCIGTRYCSNNCPYKVRRFNFMDWQSRDPRGTPYNSLFLGIPDQQQEEQVDVLKRNVFNPDVTVRMRGVMEKCTYCVQRIHGATINAKNEWAKGVRPKVKADGKTPGYIINDGEIATACQQACPTQAITFGNLNDVEAKVTDLQKSPRAYGVLADLNTRPRTKYLALIRNRDAESDAESTAEAGEVEHA